MFIDVGNPGFFKIVRAVRTCLSVNKRCKKIAKFGNPLVFEAARVWTEQYRQMCIVGGEDWAWDKMVHKLFDESIEQSIDIAYDHIVERIGYQLWLESHTRRLNL